MSVKRIIHGIKHSTGDASVLFLKQMEELESVTFALMCLLSKIKC